ncbi:hypothetical protein KZ829_15690 [Actinoplanes hulinensis]|uniref:Uncharacterized protein n=1 Tax=Actinoplanes hulinensis TaxID=1144547 RepID=A0ABS7B2E0_9ACTN|nr:hypothetical protein [Actinoplanes hulinensis]MBW6435182.1 hypothetical protein [Actinoplanes hulinensis]
MKLSPGVLAGWIFADLMAAFLVIAMGSQIPTPPVTKAAPGSSAPAPAGRKPAPARSAPLGLELEPVEIDLPDTSSVAAIRRTIRQEAPQLAGRRAGMVLTFGRGGPATGKAVAAGVNGKLPGVDPKLFGGAVYRNFHTTGGITNIEIYLYPP